MVRRKVACAARYAPAGAGSHSGRQRAGRDLADHRREVARQLRGRAGGWASISGRTSPMLISRRIVLPICRSAALGRSPPSRPSAIQPSIRSSWRGQRRQVGAGALVARLVPQRHQPGGQRHGRAQQRTRQRQLGVRRRSSPSPPGGAGTRRRSAGGARSAGPHRPSARPRARARSGVAGRRQQRRLGRERVEAAHDRARADQALAVDAHAGDGACRRTAAGRPGPGSAAAGRRAGRRST